MAIYWCIQGRYMETTADVEKAQLIEQILRLEWEINNLQWEINNLRGEIALFKEVN